MESTYVPLPHLTDTNTPLTPLEEDSIRQRLDVMEFRASDLKMELKILGRQIREYKHILSPIRRVPMEVLGEIFTCIPPEDEDRPRNYQGDVVRLSVVCKRWRDVARLVPQLWQDLYIDARKPPLEHGALNKWAHRAGNLPRSITLYANRCGQNCDSPGTIDLVLPVCLGEGICLFMNMEFREVLIKHPGMWQSLTIDCPTADCFRRFGDMVAPAQNNASLAVWSSMTSFTLLCNGWNCWPVSLPRSLFHFLPTPFTEMTLVLPDLYTFAAETRSWDIDLKILPDLLRGLASLSITSNFLSGHLFQILPHCIKLETLFIDFAGGVLDVWNNDPVTRHALQHGFTLPNLRSLVLINGASFAKLECIRMPRLVELSIATEPSCDCQIGEPSFAAFIRGDLNAESQLRRLSILKWPFRANLATTLP